MHEIHTTEGFIIGGRPYGEAGKILNIFTRKFGLVSAVAQGIRLSKSKLRYFSQDYSFGNYSLVRGKELWRLTGAMELDEFRQKNSISQIIVRISALLKRFLYGEEAHPEIFDNIKDCIVFLAVAERELSQESLEILESIIIFRIVHGLGYIGNDNSINKYLSGKISIKMLDEALPLRSKINQHINKAFKESHL